MAASPSAMGLGSVRRTAPVTGAAGFLGSHLCDRLLAEGLEVVALDNLIVRALSGRPLTLYGKGTQTRSSGYVDDTIEGFVRMLARDSLERVLQLTGLRRQTPLSKGLELTIEDFRRRLKNDGTTRSLREPASP